jgi:hypothetical protein
MCPIDPAWDARAFFFVHLSWPCREHGDPQMASLIAVHLADFITGDGIGSLTAAGTTCFDR